MLQTAGGWLRWAADGPVWLPHQRDIYRHHNHLRQQLQQRQGRGASKYNVILDLDIIVGTFTSTVTPDIIVGKNKNGPCYYRPY